MSIKRSVQQQVIEILKGSRIEGNILFLPDTKFPRKVYQELDLTLNNMGSHWDKKIQGHVFREDPTEKIQSAIENAVVTNEKQAFQEFFTPESLCLEMAQKAAVLGCDVLEPSAGKGCIADACWTLGAKSITCVEIQPALVQELKNKQRKVVQGDFLKLTPEKLGLFDAVVMNPPFSKKADILHVTHALKFLKPDGILVAIVSKPLKSIKGRIMVQEELPKATFRESGTDVATWLTCIFPSQEKPLPNHEYLAQEQDHPRTAKYEVIDLTIEGVRVYENNKYQNCEDWIEG